MGNISVFHGDGHPDSVHWIHVVYTVLNHLKNFAALMRQLETLVKEVRSIYRADVSCKGSGLKRVRNEGVCVLRLNLITVLVSLDVTDSLYYALSFNLDSEHTTDPLVASHLYLPTHLFDDLFTDGKTQPSATFVAILVLTQFRKVDK